jgi:cobalt-zinc-cadmium efflux system protein
MIGIVLNLLFVAAEAGFGFFADSVALLADAGHNLSDVLGLGAAWAAVRLAKAPASKRFTYGFKGSTILAALTNALLLLVALGAFSRGGKGDINVRAAFAHMAADAVVSAGVVVSGLVIWRFGLVWVDPAVSLIIAVLIFWQTWGLLRESVEMSLDAVPRTIDYDQVWIELRTLPGVSRVHDMHIWPMSTTETVLTAHLVVPGGHPGDDFLATARDMLKQRFAIGHATLQIEHGEDCAVDC